MIRPILTEVILFAMPFVLYVVFLWATRAGVLHPDSWPLSRIISLAIVALVLVLGSFIYFSHFAGSPVGAAYVPAHVDEKGQFVPGTVVK